MVSPHIFLQNSLDQDLLILYARFGELGLEYRDGQIYLADLRRVSTAVALYI